MPKDTAAAFRKYVDEPSHRAALAACKEMTSDAETLKLNPDFPRRLKAKERKLFERLVFKCENPGQEVFANFAGASREAALAVDSPLASVRVVLDTIRPCTPQASDSTAPVSALGAARAPSTACTAQQCTTGEVKTVNNRILCVCR